MRCCTSPSTAKGTQALADDDLVRELNDHGVYVSHAANWSAHRTLQTYPQLFSWGNVNSQSESTPLYFTGEMVLLQVVHLSSVADIVSTKGPPRYVRRLRRPPTPERCRRTSISRYQLGSTLRQGPTLQEYRQSLCCLVRPLLPSLCPRLTCLGVRYFDDMYVDFNLSQETAAQISNIEQYVTNQLFHSGVREDPKDVIKRLFQISKREYY